MGLENKIIGNGRYKYEFDIRLCSVARSASLTRARSFSRVLKEINRGGTAVVYSGIDLTQQKKVALKVMSAKHRKEGNLRAGR